MKEVIKNIDSGAYKLGVKIRKGMIILSEQAKTFRYEANKGKVESRLNFLSNEISAGKDFISGIDDPELRAKLSNKVESLVETRVGIVQSLPQYAKDKDLNKIVASRDAELDSINTETAILPQVSAVTDQLPARTNYDVTEIINEGPVDRDEVTLYTEAGKEVLPVGGGSVSPPRTATPIRPASPRVVDTTRGIASPHLEYVGSRVIPSLDGRWTSSKRDTVVMDYPRPESKVKRLWNKIRGADKEGPYNLAEDEDILRYREDLSDEMKDRYFVKQRESRALKFAALAGGIGLLWAAHEIPTTRNQLENIGIFSPSVRNTVVASGPNRDVSESVRAEMEAMRPILVRDVVNEIKTLRTEDTKAVAAEAARAAGDAVDSAVDRLTGVTTPPPLNLMVRDLRQDEVMPGNLSIPDRVAERFTGDAEESFVEGMADSLLMDNYKEELGITGEAHYLNPEHIAAYNRFRNDPNNKTYLAEREALQISIMNETQQKNPGQDIFRLVHFPDGTEKYMIRHKTKAGAAVVPILPNANAVKEITEEVKRRAVVSR